MKKLFFLGLFMFCMMANALEVSFLLDETGSMHDIKRETISGFNEYIQSVKNREEEISFTLVKFNGKRIKEIYKGISIKEVVPLNKDTYSPDDTTPLYDAVAELICKTTQSIKCKCEPVLCVIYTDGLENDSKDYTKDDILKIIKQKECEGWTFVYLGANQNAWVESQRIGVYQGNTLEWDSDMPQEGWLRLNDSTTMYIDSGAIQTNAFFDTKIDK